jgi:hypothetical protein
MASMGSHSGAMMDRRLQRSGMVEWDGLAMAYRK